MVDFSEALKAKIDGMSTDELTATETRRRSREADRTVVLNLDALWESVSQDKAAEVTKKVAVQVDAGTLGSPDILRIDGDTTFHESIILSLQVYRVIAGGCESRSPNERFVVNPGGAGHDKVSVERTALAAILARERPAEMARSRRLVDLEQRPPVSHLSVEERIAHFEQKWIAETVNFRIDSIVSQVASRAVMLLAGRDHIALWVRKEDLIVGPDRILGSPLAVAIVRPDTARTRRDVLVSADTAASDAYLGNSFGSGPERSLVLDVTQIRKAVAGMALEEQREAAMVLFDRFIERSIAIGRERSTRAKTSPLRACAAQAGGSLP